MTTTTTEREQIEQTIAALETQRAMLGDAVVDTALGPLRQKLSALQATPAEAEQRKFVTVLFADVSGFTAMSEKIDAEEVSGTMNSVWERLDASITAHGGVIDKHIGDAVMALFGIPTAREDDPERAIRAALDMQTELGAFVNAFTTLPSVRSGQALAPQPALQMRIGINTGPVLLGEVGSRSEYTAMGDTVNVASRLEHAAPVGGILISYDTYRHVRGVFDVSTLEPLAVKGKSDPVQTYLVQRAKPRAFRLGTRGVEGVETRMVGRDAELKQLQDALYTAIEDHETQAVTITGEAGVGKSRLLYEFTAWSELLPNRLRIFQGRSDPQMQNLPYSLVRDMLSTRFNILDSDPPAVARKKLIDGIRAILAGTALPADVTQEKADFIGHLAGLDFSESPYISGILDDAKQIRNRTFRYVADFFQGVTIDIPAVLMLEDLHWADDGSLDLMAYLMRECTHAPLLIVGIARTVLYERRPRWGEGLESHSRIDLHPLTKRDSRRLVADILRKLPDIPSALQELIVGGAEGNPFYLEELIKMLIDERVIVPGPERWHVEAGRLATVKVPPTLTGVLQARLDSLAPAERETLQKASIVGKVFWNEAVSRLGKALVVSGEELALASDQVSEVLDGLRSKELVFGRETSAFSGTSEYIFKHAILHDVTYESVLKRNRRVYHAQAAAWLVERSGERADEYAALIAEHYELANDTLEAARWYARAGKQAQDTYVPDAAISYYRKALSLWPVVSGPGEEHTSARLAVYEGLGDTLRWLARYEEAGETFQAMEREANAAEDTPAQSRAWKRLARAQERQGDLRASLESARQAEGLARAAGAQVELAEALDWCAVPLCRLGKLQEALALAGEALTLSTTLHARRVMADSSVTLGDIQGSLGHFEESTNYYEQALALYQELVDRGHVSVMLNSLGETARLRGDYQAAITQFKEALSISREIGNMDNEMVVLNNLGGAQMGMGDYQSAETNLRQAIELAEASGARNFLSETYWFLAIAMLGQDRVEEALEAARAAVTLAQATESQELLGGAWRALGRVVARIAASVQIGESMYEAAACFEESLHICSETGMEGERARTLREWAIYAQGQGDKEGAEAMWQEARQIFERLNMPLEVARTGEMPGG